MKFHFLTHPPQVLYPRREISEKLQNVLKMELGQALQEPLTKEKEFWGASKTLNQLASGKYFVEEGQDEAVWPQLFTEITGSSSPITIIYSGKMYSFQIISTQKLSIYVIF